MYNHVYIYDYICMIKTWYTHTESGMCRTIQRRGIVVHNQNTIMGDKTSNDAPVRDGQVKDRDITKHTQNPQLFYGEIETS